MIDLCYRMTGVGCGVPGQECKDQGAMEGVQGSGCHGHESWGWGAMAEAPKSLNIPETSIDTRRRLKDL